MKRTVLSALLLALALPTLAEAREPKKVPEESFSPEKEIPNVGVPFAGSVCAHIRGVKVYGDTFIGHAVLCVMRDQPFMLTSHKMKLLWI